MTEKSPDISAISVLVPSDTHNLPLEFLTEKIKSLFRPAHLFISLSKGKTT